MSIDTLLREFSSLTPVEKWFFYDKVCTTMANSPSTVDLTEIRESRFSKGVHCPHCNGAKIKRHGLYRGRQRYKCNECGKTFNDLTNSPMAGTHYLNKWSQHIQLIVEGKTLKKVAEALEIHISTAFYWRHKVLNTLKSMDSDQLTGVVESDETFFLESRKGKNQSKTRKALKRGGVSQFRGISREQVCVLVAMDRSGHMVSVNAGNGRITAKQINEAMGSQISPNAILCTDSAKNYAYFSKLAGIEHYKVNVNKRKYVTNEIYHIQHVNSYHERISTWINRTRKGVATKYMNNYLTWHKFLEQNKAVNEVKLREILLKQLFSVDIATTNSILKSLRVA